MEGKTIIYDDVFISLTRIVLESADEIFYHEKKGNFPQLFGDKTAKSGITLHRKNASDDSTEDTVSFELRLSVLYGVSIPDTLHKIREVLSNEIKAITGFNVEAIDINVEHIIRIDKSETADSIEVVFDDYADSESEADSVSEPDPEED